MGYKIGLQKIRLQKAQIRRDPVQTLNDFQRLVGDISHLWCTIGIGPDELIHLNKTLDGDKDDLNSPRELLAEVEKELALIEEKLKTHVDCVALNLNCILVILPSKQFTYRNFNSEGRYDLRLYIFTT